MTECMIFMTKNIHIDDINNDFTTHTMKFMTEWMYFKTNNIQIDCIHNYFMTPKLVFVTINPELCNIHGQFKPTLLLKVC